MTPVSGRMVLDPEHRFCPVVDCGRPSRSRFQQLCEMHYIRARLGRPMDAPPVLRGDPIGRFWQKVERCGPDECWPWLGATYPDGYGEFRGSDGRLTPAHRFSYQLTGATIPEGLVIDHLCRNRRCVNPAHMEAVTPRVNTLRGVGIAARNAAKTHCPAGHAYDAANTYRAPGKPHRECRTCHREKARLRRSKRVFEDGAYRLTRRSS